MTIETKDGDPEVIEEALDKYGLVVRGEMPIEEFTEDKLLVLELKDELRTAKNKVERYQDQLEYQNEDIKDFKEMLKLALDKPAPIIEVKPDIDVTVNPIIQNDFEAKVSNNIQISQEFSGIQDEFKELLDRLSGDSEDFKEIENIQNGLKKIEGKPPEEVEKSSIMGTFKSFLKKLESAEEGVGRTINGVKDGVETARKLASHYNKIAQWCGLPIVPKPFTK